MTHYRISNIGGRSVNEDAALCMEHGGDYCFIVADGLGAHGKGEIASDLVVHAFENTFHEANSNNLAFMTQAFDKAQSMLLAAQQTKNEMKTTCVALSLIKNKCVWGHIGDSRLYYFHNRKLRGRTLDHSVPQMMAIAKQIKECEIASHPDRNRLLRVMGEKWESPRYELSKEIKLRKGDAFLLCTDGFWEYITEKEIISLLKNNKTAEAWLTAMLQIVEANGDATCMDNYTAITVVC